jgi:hypothetical protein
VEIRLPLAGAVGCPVGFGRRADVICSEGRQAATGVPYFFFRYARYGFASIVDRRATLLDNERLPPEESIRIIRLQAASGADRAPSDARS